MQTRELAKRLGKVLPVLVMLVAVVSGLLLGGDLYQTALGSQPNPPTQLLLGPNHPEPLTALGAAGSCISSYIYTSLPPKCKTSDGSFIQANGPSPFVMLIPQAK